MLLNCNNHQRISWYFKPLISGRDEVGLTSSIQAAVWSFAICDSIANLAFDFIYISYLKGFLTGWPQKLVWLGLCPTATYVIVNIMMIILQYSDLPTGGKFDEVKRYTSILLAFSKVMIHTATIFYIALRCPQSGTAIPGKLYLPFISSLALLVVSCTSIFGQGYKSGLYGLCWAADFAVFHFFVDGYVQKLDNGTRKKWGLIL